MSIARSLLVALLVSALPTTLGGCAADDGPAAPIEGEEQALTEAKALARGVTSPTGLTVAGNHIYFGSSHFVASGDPELDQEFAYWDGKFARVPLAGGKQELVADIGPIGLVRQSGSKLYYAMAQGCWISRIDTAETKPKSDSIYSYSECDDQTGQGIQHFEIAGDKLYMVEDDGKLIVTNLEGKNPKTIGKSLVPGWGGVVSAAALAGDSMYIATNGSGKPAAIYKVALSDGKATKVLETGKTLYDLTSDGANLYWADDTTVKRLPVGAKAAEDAATGFGSIVDIATDGGKLYVADSKRGAVYVVADGTKKKLAAVKGITDVVASGGTLYVGSHVVEGKKALGIIGAIKL